MLKIKDNVDLKELEKFGFKNTINDTWIKYTANSDNRYETGILVNPLYTEIKNKIVYYTNNTEDLEDIQEDYIDLTSELDILYGLIQAGLVEKVSD